MNDYLCIPNWEDMQHYKDRSPPWIKLHNELLESYEFECLQDASKAHLLCIWLLASRTGNKIKADPKWISRKIGANSDIDIKELIDSGFLLLKQELPSVEQDASKVLQGMEQSACLEGEGEQSRIEGEESIKTLVDSKKKPSTPYQQIVDLYNQMLGDEFKAVIKIDVTGRKAKIKKFWNDMDKDINKVESYFGYFKQHAEPWQKGQSDRKWTADIEYIIKDKTVENMRAS